MDNTKSTLIVLVTVVISILIVISIFLYQRIFTYRSAFEADKACHYRLGELMDTDKSIDCDHDFETRQWILFENVNANSSFQVLERFYY